MSAPKQIKLIKAFTLGQCPINLKVLDQTLLPREMKFVDVTDTKDGYRVIKDMLVRGAPCIAAVGCLSVISELTKSDFRSTKELTAWLNEKSQLLISSRPTAVNLKQALNRLSDFARTNENNDVETFVKKITELCLNAIDIGKRANERLGNFGASELMRNDPSKKITVLTHCNTGSLATVGHGTALGVIRSLWNLDKLERAYCTETRPYNQGSRLTAWELVQENIPATLIADNMIAYLMATKKIDSVVVGADRVTLNGDIANKIGTLQLAVISKHYGVPFFVAAPTQSIDLETSTGLEIKIEQRPADELRYIGSTQLAPDNVDVWNPCFDVTPANLISGIITEFGVCKTNEIKGFLGNIELQGSESALF